MGIRQASIPDDDECVCGSSTLHQKWQVIHYITEYNRPILLYLYMQKLSNFCVVLVVPIIGNRTCKHGIEKLDSKSLNNMQQGFNNFSEPPDKMAIFPSDLD